jgi:hypothetical protein
MSHHPIDRTVPNVSRTQRPARRSRPWLEPLEQRELPVVTVFQQGVPVLVNGTATGAAYTSTQDVDVSAFFADRAGDFSTVRAAGPNDPLGVNQALLRLENLFGTGPNQIPIGARINAAALTVEVPLTSTFNVALHRMLGNWTEASTWNSLTNGVQTNNVEAVATPESGLSPALGVGPRSFDVTTSLQTWSYTTQPNTSNRGWVLVMAGGGVNQYWEFESSETTTGRAPILAVDWTAPTPGTLNFSAATASVNENAGTATITVTRTDGGVGAVAVNYAATNGTGTAGQDFTAVSGTLNFAANEFSRTFTIPITNDTQTERDETINLALSSPTSGAVLGAQATAVLTITDNDAPDTLQFTAATFTASEGTATATITVTRTGASTGPASVQFEALRGSATPGQDFTPVTGTLTWAAGDRNPKTFTVAILNDTLREPTERLGLVLRNPSGGAALGSQSTAVLAITDNEPALTFQQGVAGYTGVQDSQIRENLPNTVLTDNSPTNPGLIRVDGEDGGGIVYGLIRFDNIFGTGPSQIPLGSTIVEATLTLDLTEDGVNGIYNFHRMVQDWSHTTATWNFFGGNGINLDGIEALATPDATVGNGSFTVPLGAMNANVTSSLQAWSAGAPNRGWNFRTPAVTTDGILVRSSENGTTNLRPQLAVSFLPPVPGYFSFGASSYSIEEAGTSLTVTVNREFGAVGAVSVNYATGDGTATAGQDYTATSGTLTFAAGETSKTFTVPILNDALVESGETILLTLGIPTGGASLGDVADAVVTIADNDGPGVVQFGAPTVTVNENGGAAVLTVSRTQGSEFAGTVTVEYAVSTGTAADGVDFTGAAGTVTFGPGVTSQTISLALVDDSLDETNETFTLILRNPTAGAALGNQASTVLTILDNERSLVLQEGLNGYAATQDASLRAANAGAADGSGGTIVTDLDDGGLQVQSLLRFDNLFGNGPNQIPSNAIIHAATLTVQVANESDGRISIHRMLVNWNEGSTWNSLNNGVQPVTEAALSPENPPLALPGATGPRSFDVTAALQAWRAGASNFGWVFLNTSTNGWDIQSSEAATGLLRPRLEVVFTAPAATVAPRVTSFAGGANGFTLGFNQALNPGTVNVFGNASDPLGLPDVTLVGPTGPVAGSLIVNPTNAGVNAPFNGVLTFVPSGGPLAPGSYTVTLRSAADGVQGLYGNLLLDGNGDGTAGDNYTNTFTVAAPAATARVVSLPSFVRGPGQPVNLPTNLTIGIPVRLSNGQGVTAVNLQIRYDPALLTFTAAAGVPAGSTATLNTNTPGLAVVTFSSPTALAAGAIDFLRLTASVPAGAPYSAKHVLNLLNVTINAGTTAVPAADDDGVHVVSYLGDLNGNGAYESADAVLLDRLLGGTNAGFASFQLADPALVADVTQDGQVTTADSSAALQLAAGTALPNVPPRPANPATPLPGGADPRLYLPTDLAGLPGMTVTVPVLLEVTDPAGASVTGVDVTLRYDPSRFAISNLQLGDLLAGFRASFNTEVPGELRLVAFTGQGPELAHGASGALFLVDLTVLPGAAAGASVLNLVASLGGTTTALYGNDLRPLLLVPAPTDGASDAVDGRFTVLAAEAAAFRPAGAVPNASGGSHLASVPGPNGQGELDSPLAALAVLLAGADAGAGEMLSGDLGGTPAVAARDAVFQSYGSDDRAVSVAFRTVPMGGGISDEASDGLEGDDSSDLFGVDALFGSPVDRG